MSRSIFNICFITLLFWDNSALSIPDTTWNSRQTCNKTEYDQKSQYICYVSDVYITQPSEFYYRSNNYGARDIGTLFFENTKMHFLPSSLFTKLAVLRVLKCVNCELTEIYRTELQGANLLEEIDFSHNNLTSLGKNNFVPATKLQIIDLSYNKIRDIDEAAFKLLGSVRVLNLTNNEITILKSDLFASMTALEVLKLGGNKITSIITDKHFVNQNNLIELYLNDNNIESVAANVKSGFKSLKVLNIAVNRIGDFLFENNMLDMRLLNISHNNLTKLHVQIKTKVLDASQNNIFDFSLESPRSLVMLKMQHNNLQNSDFITEMVNLKYLDLSQNSLITKFNTTYLIPLTSLEYLYLENVNLTSINFMTFAYQTFLKVLDVSYNNLGAIDFNDFSSLLQLEQLFIDGNSLTKIEALTDFNLFCPNLKFIGLSDNLFSCQHLREVVKHLLILKIRIYVDPNNVVRNQLNFRGISCLAQNKTSSATVADVKLFPQHLPEHTNLAIDDFKSKYNAELVEIRQVLNDSQYNKTQLEKTVESLQFQLNQMKNLTLSEESSTMSSPIYTEKPENQNYELNQTNYDDLKHQLTLIQNKMKSVNPPINPVTSNPKINDNVEINRKIDELFKIVSSDRTPQKSVLKSSERSSEPLELKPSSLPVIVDGHDNKMADDIVTTKTLITLMFIAGLVFVVFKITTLYFYKRPNGIFRRSNATIATIMEDNI